MDGITSSVGMNLGKLQERSLECWNAGMLQVHGVAKSWRRIGDLTTTVTILNGERLNAFLLRSRKASDIFPHCVFFFLCLFICLGHRCCTSFSLAVASRDYLQVRFAGFSGQWLPLLRSTVLGHAGFSSCVSGAHWLWLLGSRAQAY